VKQNTDIISKLLQHNFISYVTTAQKSSNSSGLIKPSFSQSLPSIVMYYSILSTGI